MLPTDAKERKAIPIYSGFINYFPDAIVEVTKVSKRGNDQHNPGKPLHWDRSKSGDELDALTRHLIDSTNPNLSLDDEIEEAAARTWRSLADLQKLVEKRDKIAASRQFIRETYEPALQEPTAVTVRREDAVDLMRDLRKVDDGSIESRVILAEYLEKATRNQP